MVLSRLRALLTPREGSQYECGECGAAFDVPRHGPSNRRCPDCGAAAVERA